MNFAIKTVVSSSTTKPMGFVINWCSLESIEMLKILPEIKEKTDSVYKVLIVLRCKVSEVLPLWENIRILNTYILSKRSIQLKKDGTWVEQV